MKKENLDRFRYLLIYLRATEIASKTGIGRVYNSLTVISTQSSLVSEKHQRLVDNMFSLEAIFNK